MNNPTTEEIAAARAMAGQTTTEAAAEVHAAVRTWQQWESGDRKMPRAAWELYLLSTGQHPEKKLIKSPVTHLRRRSMSA